MPGLAGLAHLGLATFGDDPNAATTFPAPPNGTTKVGETPTVPAGAIIQGNEDYWYKQWWFLTIVGVVVVGGGTAGYMFYRRRKARRDQ